MYIPLPGILSQVTGFVVDGNIGKAITAFLSEAVEAEVHGTLPYSYIGLIEEYQGEVSSTENAIELNQIEIVDREPIFTKPFVDLELVETASTEVYSISSNAVEIIKTKIVSRELQAVGYFIDLSGVTGSEFLSGSPGYVAGIPTPAVEIVAVEVGYLPLPLPVGFSGIASEVFAVEGANIEVFSPLAAAYQTHLEIAKKELTFVATAIEVQTVEVPVFKVYSAILFKELTTVDAGQIWLNKPSLEILEISLTESSEKELQQIVATYELLLTNYATESLIIKP